MPSASPSHLPISPFHRLVTLLQTERTALWVAVVYSVAIGLLTLVVPIAVQSVVNTIAFGTLLQPLVVLTLVVLAGLGFSAVLQGMRTYVIEMLQRRVFVRVSSESVHRLLNARMEAFDHHHGPELVNRFFDVVTVQKSGAMLLLDGLSILMQTLVGMVLLAVYHPYLLAFDILLLCCIVIVLFPMARGAIATSIAESRAKYDLVAWLEEIARWPAAFKAASGAAYATERADSLVAQYLTHRGKHFRILLRQILGSLLLQAVASSILLGVGGLLVIQRQLTLGQLIAAELIVTLVVSGFSKFGKQIETSYDLMAALDKLGYLTDLPLEDSGSETPHTEGQGMAVRLNKVTFSYSSGALILRDVDWDAPPNARIGVTGHGKSTLLDLVCAIRTPTSGAVEIDNHDLRQLDLLTLRSQIALVRQPEIFHGTIAANVRLSKPGASSADVREALQKAELLEEVQSLPDGVETDLATGGSPLSPSQGIRLMIARAWLAQPRLLLLDECLDFIGDMKQRQSLMGALFSPSNHWTLIVVAKDPAILAFCDQVFKIQQGSVTRI